MTYASTYLCVYLPFPSNHILTIGYRMGVGDCGVLVLMMIKGGHVKTE